MATEQNKAKDTDLNEFESNLIRRKAASMARRRLIPNAEVEDVEQELAMALLVAQGKVTLDRKRRDSFAARIVRNAASNLVRSRFVAKRHPSRVCSLDALLEKWPKLLDRIAVKPATQPTQDVRQDFDELLDKLPDELRQLAEALKTKSVSELAKELGVPRNTLASRLRAIGKLLKACGYQKFS